jgi:hypothetical protein
VASSTTINPEVLAVQPGGQAECQVRVRNTSTIVDQFSFEALGPAASWVAFEPASLSLFPDSEGLARLIVRPPKASDTPAGACPVGVWVRSREDPANSAIEECTVEVGQLVDTNAELIPRTSRHARKATHTLAVDNSGNTRLNVALSASDPDDRLRFEFEPDSITAEAGEAAFAKVRVIPLKRFLRGPEVHHPFQVFLKPDGQAPAAVPGTMVQQALIPRWLPRALVGLVALVLMLAALWATVLRPVVRTTARATAKDTAADAIKANTDQTAGLIKQMAHQQEQQQKAAAAAAAGGGAGAATGTAPGTPAAKTPAENAFDGRLQIGPGKSTDSYTVPTGKRLALTDIVLQNPQGDSGLLRIQRGTTTLLTVRLENFRDLDYHFVTPVTFAAGDRLILSIDCANSTPQPPPACSPAAYYNGVLAAV